jgi:hypothetical protein
MGAKEKNSWSSSLLNMFTLFTSLYNVFIAVGHRLKQDAKAAGKNMLALVILSCFSFILCSSIWLCINALLFFYLLSIKLSILISLFIITLINSILLLIILLSILKIKNKLLFPHTRKLLEYLPHKN